MARLRKSSFQTACAAALAAGVLTLGACSTQPVRYTSLEQARATVESVAAMPEVTREAPAELGEARQALSLAEQYAAGRADRALIDHEAYLAQRHAETARALTNAAQYEARVKQAESERQRVQIEVREHAAATAQARAASAEQRASELEMALEELKAQPTERGLVLTLGDVLFEVDRATLKAGALPTIDRLAQFMNDYPQRRVRIEGHTDSQGSSAYNEELSQRRADAVRAALVDRGIDPARIVSEGRGEDYPVATNDTAAGRQQNRRVEIVISDDSGRLSPA